MDRIAHQGPVTAAEPRSPTERFLFDRAAPSDDASIRRLLREESMGGAVALTLEREPQAALADTIAGDRTHRLVLRGGDPPRVLALGSRAVRTVYLNGRPRCMGYLGQLRRDPVLHGRLSLLAQAYQAVEATREPDELPYDLTSILADNTPARRLLEKGLRSLPTYQPVADWMTLIIPVHRRAMRRHGSRIRTAGPSDLAATAQCLQRNYPRYQFAPLWTERDLRSPHRCRGLRADDFLIAVDGERIIGCLAIWDQRSFKQVVVQHYRGLLGLLRPLVNATARAVGRPPFAPPGGHVPLAYLSHCAVDHDDPDVLAELVNAARMSARNRGLHYLALGLAADNPMRPMIERTFSPRICRSMLYLVYRGDLGPSAPDPRLIPHVEVATL